jgi:outer membrane protein assembly factor BamD (BamD/ComL family)
MSVAGILSSSLFDYNNPTVQSQRQKLQQEFQQLGQDLQSGNLTAAQTDFTTLQQSGPQANSSLSTQTTSPIAQDFKQLGQDLQSGNVTAAQQDYAKIQQDFQSQTAGNHAHHHHHGGGGGGGNAVSQLMQELGQDLQNGSLTVAQQAYAALQQGLPQFAQNTDSSQPSTLTSNNVSVTA